MVEVAPAVPAPVTPAPAIAADAPVVAVSGTASDGPGAAADTSFAAAAVNTATVAGATAIDLDKAVQSGIITAKQAEDLKATVTVSQAPAEAAPAVAAAASGIATSAEGDTLQGSAALASNNGFTSLATPPAASLADKFAALKAAAPAGPSIA